MAEIIQIDATAHPRQTVNAAHRDGIAIGKDSGAFTTEVTQDAREITPRRLETVDVLVFYTTGALPISPENWKAIQDWVASGRGGFIGLHSAADTGLDFPADVGTPILAAADGEVIATGLTPGGDIVLFAAQGTNLLYCVEQPTSAVRSYRLRTTMSITYWALVPIAPLL